MKTLRALHRISVAIAAACMSASLLPLAAAHAQVGPGPRTAPARPLSARELAPLDPARALNAQQKELKLDREQRARLDTISKAHQARVVQEFRGIDSLRKVMNSVPRVERGRQMDSVRFAAYDAAVGRAQEARREILGRLVVLKEAFDSTAVRSMSVLTDEQRPAGSRITARATLQAAALLRSFR